MNTPDIGEASKPRFEFRSFGHQFDSAHQRMAELSVPVPEAVRERHSEEVYIISRKDDTNNVKIRGGKMDIKTFIQTVDGLEQWEPSMKEQFPLPRSVLLEKVLPALQVDMDLPEEPSFTASMLTDLVRHHPDLETVSVQKQRFGYMVHDTICEYAVVWINDTCVATVSAESTERDAVHWTLNDTGLEGVENINYLQAIKRVIGMVSEPLAN